MIDKNDPRLTAYVLGELEKSNTDEIDAALKSSAELRSSVAEIRQTTEALAGVFQAEPKILLDEKRKNAVLAAASANSDVHSLEAPNNDRDHTANSNRFRRWLPIAVAAGLMCVLVGGGIYLSQSSSQMANRHAVDTSHAATAPAAAALEDNQDKSSSFESGAGAAPDDIGAKIKQAHRSADRRLTIEKDNQPSLPGSRNKPSMARSMHSEFVAPSNLLADDKSTGSPSKPVASRKNNAGAGLTNRQLPAEGTAFGAASANRQPTIEMAANGAATEILDNRREARSTVSPSRTTNDAALAQRPNTIGDDLKNQTTMPDPGLIKTAKEIQLAQTQKMIDQSKLGIVGMTVVVAPQPEGFGAGFGDRKAIPKMIPDDDYALQISDAAAEQVVKVLVSNVDSKNKRQLSFDDLIDVAATNRSKSASKKEQDPKNKRNKVSKIDREAQLRDQAVQLLAFNLRGFINQRAPDPQSRMGMGGGAIDLVPDVFGDDSDTVPTVDSKTESATEKLPNQPPHREPRQHNAWSNLDLLNLDYSQVIEQLKRSLDRRNEKLKTD